MWHKRVKSSSLALILLLIPIALVINFLDIGGVANVFRQSVGKEHLKQVEDNNYSAYIRKRFGDLIQQGEEFNEESIPESTENGENDTIIPVIEEMLSPEPDIEATFRTIGLKGRHSDFTSPPCDETDVEDTELDTSKPMHYFPETFKYLPNYKNPCWFEGPDESNQTLRCIPYFYLIGTVKAATTDLITRILLHPQVITTDPLEKRWFERKRFQEGPEAVKLDYYIDMFKKPTQEVERSVTPEGYHKRVFGDDSPTLLFQNDNWQYLDGNQHCTEPRVLCISHLHHLLPTAKLVLIVRHPVDRLYSDYLFNTKVMGGNATPEQFHQWAVKCVELFQSCLETQPFRRCLYGPETKTSFPIGSFPAGMYSRHILDILKIFPRKQLHILQTEDYEYNVESHMHELYTFLELDTLSKPQMEKLSKREQLNKGSRYNKSGEMLPETRELLTDFYQPYNEELAHLLNDKKYLWLSDSTD